jgi:hypothetical protein
MSVQTSDRAETHRRGARFVDPRLSWARAPRPDFARAESFAALVALGSGFPEMVGEEDLRA